MCLPISRGTKKGKDTNNPLGTKKGKEKGKETNILQSILKPLLGMVAHVAAALPVASD